MLVLLVTSALVVAVADLSLASLRDDTLRSRIWLMKLLALAFASGVTSELVVVLQVVSEYEWEEEELDLMV